MKATEMIQQRQSCQRSAHWLAVGFILAVAVAVVSPIALARIAISSEKPTGLVFDQSGNLYIAQPSLSRVT
jgi:hypothetical protein